MSIKAAYEPIDIHKPAAGTWPTDIPALTEKAAALALRRLYRFAMGQRYTGEIRFSTGNRRPTRFDWIDKGHFSVRVVYINVSKGWREFIHDLSHDFDILANGSSQHSKHHARLERKLVAEVVKRGWLSAEPEIVVSNVVAIVPPEDALRIKREQKLARIQSRVENWLRKLKRAENALRKLNKQERYYQRALGN